MQLIILCCYILLPAHNPSPTLHCIDDNQLLSTDNNLLMRRTYYIERARKLAVVWKVQDDKHGHENKM